MFDLDRDPFENFLDLLQQAQVAKVPEPTAMTLATSTLEGRPSARMVLFKGLVREGFSFYTNYQSPKAQDLIANPQASVVFFWEALKTQVRVYGSVKKLTSQESTAYFQSRPRLSQIGAWASAQSQQIANIEELEQKVVEIETRFKDQDPLPCPPFWGGFHVVPQSIEFWFGKEGRLHERFLYEKQRDGSWRRSMRSP